MVICGATDDIRKEGNVKDTGILGLTAIKNYLNQFDTFSVKDIAWK